MEQTALREVEKLALKKQKIFDQSIIKYLLRAILATGFIGFGVIVAFKAGNLFYLEHSPMAYPMAAITFGVAIILIAYAGADLFTGNTFYFTYAALRGKMSWTKVVQMWIATYSGNLIGALIFAGFISLSGLFASQDVNSFLMSVAETKMNAPVLQLFFRAILCNWLICLAFYIPMTLKGDGPKLFTMVLLVFCFFISGYEHCIANMSTFAVALVVDHPDTISIGKAIYNIIPVTLGNMIGGIVFMALYYYYVSGPIPEDENELSE
ncbi:transporter [Lysinibacillus contaminans]|uniref:Transporter n=1 Tax=Lysinibacillus contaminans TaxID=1293441 RepID=A0ABR5K3U3_9BACI|nr:formate/nitrite transporter family protein [Lysinibacillus contaminans]KOS69391.1 transporter [Lysinibacillus contaminans]